MISHIWLFFSADVIPIASNNLLETIPNLYEEFDVAFDLYINDGWGPNAWRSVLRLTNTDNDKDNFGDRLAMFMVNGELTKVLFTSAANPSPHVPYSHVTTVPHSRWIPIRIQQKVIEDRFKLIYWYDGTAVKEILMDRPRVYNNTKVLAGDRFKGALSGTLRNLTITTCKSLFVCKQST